MAAEHAEYNRRKAAGASAKDLGDYLDSISVPKEHRKKFRDTANAAARRSNMTPEQKAAETQRATAKKADTRSTKSGAPKRSAALQEAHDTISGALATTRNPVKVEYRNEGTESWSSRMYPPAMVPEFLQQHPSNDVSLTLSDDDRATQFHLAKGPGVKAPPGHVTGGRTLVGSRTPSEIEERAKVGLPTESTTAQVSRGPNYTPPMARAVKNRINVVKSQQQLARAQAEDVSIPKPLADLALQVDTVSRMAHQRRNELEARPVTEIDNPVPPGISVRAGDVAAQAAREEHARLKASDPTYAAQASVAAQHFAHVDTALKTAETRNRSTQFNVARDRMRLTTVRPVENVNYEEGLARPGDRGSLPTMGSEEVQGHVFETPRQTRAVHQLLSGISEGNSEIGVGHLRNAEAALDVQYPTAAARTDDAPGMRGGLPDARPLFSGVKPSEASARQAHIHWQMGQVPMYRGAIANPEHLRSAASAVGGSSSGSLPEIAGSIPLKPNPMKDAIGVPHAEYQQIQSVPARADIADPMRDAARGDIIEHIRSRAAGSALLPGAYATGAHSSLEGPLETARQATQSRSTGQSRVSGGTPVANLHERVAVLQQKEKESQDRIASARDLGLDPFAAKKPKKRSKK